MTWTSTVTAAALILNTLRLRGRVRTLPVLDDAHPGHLGDPTRYRLITVAGVQVPPAIARAAARHAAAEGLDVLDLVPADLPADRLLDLARQVDPATYVGDALALGRTAAHAFVVSGYVLERAGIQVRYDLRTVEMLTLAVRRRHHAPLPRAHP